MHTFRDHGESHSIVFRGIIIINNFIVGVSVRLMHKDAYCAKNIHIIRRKCLKNN